MTLFVNLPPKRIFLMKYHPKDKGNGYDLSLSMFSFFLPKNLMWKDRNTLFFFTFNPQLLLLSLPNNFSPLYLAPCLIPTETSLPGLVNNKPLPVTISAIGEDRGCWREERVGWRRDLGNLVSRAGLLRCRWSSLPASPPSQARQRRLNHPPSGWVRGQRRPPILPLPCRSRAPPLHMPLASPSPSLVASMLPSSSTMQVGSQAL